MMVEFHTWLAETEDKKKPFKDIKEIIKRNETLVTLNENGQSFTSRQLAKQLLNYQNQNITFESVLGPRLR